MPESMIADNMWSVAFVVWKNFGGCNESNLSNGFAAWKKTCKISSAQS